MPWECKQWTLTQSQWPREKAISTPTNYLVMLTLEVWDSSTRSWMGSYPKRLPRTLQVTFHPIQAGLPPSPKASHTEAPDQASESVCLTAEPTANKYLDPIFSGGGGRSLVNTEVTRQ